MKEKIIYIIKYSKIVYRVYFSILSSLLGFFSHFVKTDEKLILFNSFGGRKFDDSPKAIYELMKKDRRFRNYRLVWALQEPSLCDDSVEVVKGDTFSFFKTALAARVWITNSSMERGLRFKKKQTLYINSWHGSAIKKMGIDIPSDNTSFHAELSKEDIMLAQSEYDVDIFSHAFQIPREKFRIVGLPRNDELVHYSSDRVRKIKANLGIPEGKKVLLYAPTFREYEKGAGNQVTQKIPMDLAKWQEQLSEQFVVLFRVHYEVAKYTNVNDYSVFVDVSNYPALADLMIVSDALISDYSSIFFDYSVMHKPMYCFAYDYEDYTAHRGMYLNLKDELPCVIHRDEDGLLKEIKTFDSQESEKNVVRFQKKYATACGEASQAVCDMVAEMLEKNQNV